jgi:hypothetical protein
MARSQDNPGYWRKRAERIRMLAETMGDSDVARLMLDLVDDYEARAAKCTHRPTLIHTAGTL